MTDVETSQVKWKQLKSHDAAIYKVRPINDYLLASGDDEGSVKLWDVRANKCVMEDRGFDDYVSDFFIDPEERTLVAASGEGVIQSFNLRSRKQDVMSEVYEGEITSFGLVHHDSKMVAGCGDGKLYMFNLDRYGLHTADFGGHPDAINDLVAVTDNIVITACEDGTIR